MLATVVEGRPVEVQIQWSDLKLGFFDTYDNPDGQFFPDIDVLRAIGHRAIDTDTHAVTFKLAPEKCDEAVRWCRRERIPLPHLYGRFSWETQDYRIDRRYHGVRFVFKDPCHAALFMMTFA